MTAPGKLALALTLAVSVYAGLEFSPAAARFIQHFPFSGPWLPAGAALATGALCIFLVPHHDPFVRDSSGRVVHDRRKIVCRVLPGLAMNQATFCRHTLITGDTGAGKTSSAMHRIMWSLFENVSDWGGVVLDEKGNAVQTLRAMARAHGREHDVIEVSIGSATGQHYYNPLDDQQIPYTTLAGLLIDAHSAMTRGTDTPFFRGQANVHIANVIEIFRELNEVPLLGQIYDSLNVQGIGDLVTRLSELTPTDRREKLCEFYATSLLAHRSSDQTQGEVTTAQQALAYFREPEIAAVFSAARPNTFSMADVDKGKIICISLPKQYKLQKRFFSTLFKLLLYQHAGGRFDRHGSTPEILANCNLLTLFADEWQEFITAPEDGTCDYKELATLREAQLAVVASTQSAKSLEPPQGAAKAAVMRLNFRNWFLFAEPDASIARMLSEIVGTREVDKVSTTDGGPNGTTRTRHKHEVPIYKPAQFMALKYRQAIVKIANRNRWVKRRIPGMTASGERIHD